MNVPLLDLKAQYNSIKDEINAAVAEVFESQHFILGPEVEYCERAIAAYSECSHAVGVSSGSDALLICLMAENIGPGDEVITTAYTFTATVEVLRYLGAHPVLVDIDPVTLNIAPQRLEAAITPRTKAVIPVHIGGLACDMAAILAVASRRGLKVIEDAAHALPTTYNGQLIGTLNSDATVFSFYSTKTITTGEGGMLVTRNQRMAARCRVMRLHGIDRDAFDRYTSTRPAWYYEVVAPGFKYNMTDIAASLGIHQLKKALEFQRRRNEIAHFYNKTLADLPLVRPAQALPHEMHAWHLYVIRLTDDAGIDRNKMIDELAKRGIGTSVHFIPLNLHPYWRREYGLKPDDFPNAVKAWEKAISLPIYPKMTDEDCGRVAAAVREVLNNVRS